MDILTELQKEVLRVLFQVEEIKRSFYLTGGTALSAFYFQHRLSEDLDLFTHDQEIDTIDRLVHDALTQHHLSCVTERKSATFRRYRINDELQVDLVRDREFRVGSPHLIDNIMVDAKKNIAVNKVGAMYGRLEPKDYVDLFFLLQSEKFDILELIKLSKNKDAGMEEFQWSKVITDVDVLHILPKMLKPCSLDELKTFFHGIRDQVLDSLNPHKSA